MSLMAHVIFVFCLLFGSEFYSGLYDTSIDPAYSLCCVALLSMKVTGVARRVSGTQSRFSSLAAGAPYAESRTHCHRSQHDR